MNNKKGVSLMISYVLLIAIVVTLAVIVSSWIYFQAKNPPIGGESCDGVSVTAENIYCEELPEGKFINFDIYNTGRFTVEKVLVRVDAVKGEIVRDSLTPYGANDELPILPEGNSFYHGDYTGVRNENLNFLQLIPVRDGTICSVQSVIFKIDELCDPLNGSNSNGSSNGGNNNGNSGGNSGNNSNGSTGGDGPTEETCEGENCETEQNP